MPSKMPSPPTDLADGVGATHAGKVYAAPSLVHHYVVAHDYRPPDEFIAAVLAWDEPT